MASAAGVAGVRATLDLGNKSSQCVHCGEPYSARITGNPEVMSLDQYRETPFPTETIDDGPDPEIRVAMAT
jgi:hypothetical protein